VDIERQPLGLEFAKASGVALLVGGTLVNAGVEGFGKLGGCSASIPPALLPPFGPGSGLGGSFSGGSATGLGLGIDYGGCALGGCGNNNYLGGYSPTANNQMPGNYYSRLPGQSGFTGPQNDSTMTDSWPNGQRYDMPPGGSFAADPLVPGASTSSSYVPPLPGGSGYGSPMQPLPHLGGLGGFGMPVNDSPFPPSNPTMLSPLQPGASLPPTLPSNSLAQAQLTTGETPKDVDPAKADRTAAREKARKDRVPTPIRPGNQARARVKRSTSRSACC